MKQKVEIKCSGHLELPLSQLIEFQGNLKTLSKKNYEKLKKEILTIGFSEPFSVWKSSRGYLLLNGHQRARTLKAMAEEGYELPSKFPVSMVDSKDEAEAKRKVLALTSQYGEITGEGLYEFMHSVEGGLSLEEMEENFSFPEVDLREFESEFFESEAKEDEVPEPPKDPVTKPGDLWKLGDSKILCGDSSELKNYQRLFDGESQATLFATDPPYFVDYKGNDRPVKGKDWGSVYKEIDLSEAPRVLKLVFENASKFLKPEAPWYLWHADKHAKWLVELWESLGIHWHQTIIWVKPSLVPTYAFWHYQHEPCLLGYRERKNFLPKDGYWSNKYSSVWQLDYDGHKRQVGNDHPTQKPVELFARPIRTHTQKGDIVLEPFSGSGTQIIAATQSNRRCFAIELSPVFVDVAIERWKKLTGQSPEKVNS